MNYGWGVLPLGVVAGESFRDYTPSILAITSGYAPRATGGTVREEPPVFLFQARAPGPNTFAGIFDSLPTFLFEARLPGPLAYKIVYEYPPVVATTARFPVPEDGEVSLLAPRAVFYGYQFDGTTLSIPIADLVGLSAAEADAVTGDWREVFKALLISATEYHRNFQWSIQPRTYEPFWKELYYGDHTNSHFQVKFLIKSQQPNVAPEP